MEIEIADKNEQAKNATVAITKINHMIIKK